jgi:outer membrane receptor protein involved in Fe transport
MGLAAAVFVLADITPALAEGAQLEEIIVTARKREESMQDVPVAIQAFDAETIERYAATNLNELADLAVQVGMYPGSSGNGANLVVRGYGSTSLDPGIEGSVGINIDGVQIDRGHVIRQAFFDLQSVEILKGPQALFFGKNSPAGVVAAISALPGDEFESRISVGWEAEAEETLVEAMISAPITDTFGARFAMRLTDTDGWIKNTGTFAENSNGELFPAEPYDFPGGANDLGSEQLFSGRLTLDWAPNDVFRGTWRINYTDMENDGFQTNENNNCSGDLPITQGVFDPEGDCELDLRTAHGSLPIELAEAYSRDIGNGDPYGLYESVLSSLNLEFAFDWGTITAVTGYYQYDYERWDNFDGTNFIQLMGLQVEDQEQWSQEIRLLTSLNGPINFMAGVFYETFERNSDNAGKIEALGFDSADLTVGPSQDTGFSNTWEGISTVNSDTYSVFGQVIWDINDQWELTAGVRYTDDSKDAEQGNVYVKSNDIPGVPIPGFGFDDLLSPAGEIIESDFSDEEWSPEVTITYRPNDDVTLWAAYKTGYKSGGFSTNTVISALSFANPDSLVFDPETAEGGELGFKTTLVDGRMVVNGTLYRYTFDDVQISVFNSATTSFSVDNAAAARTTGFELESNFLATEKLLLRAQLGGNEGTYKDFITAPCYGGQTPAQGCNPNPDPLGSPTTIQDLSGEDLTRAPRWQGSIGFDYNTPLGRNWGFRWAAEAVYSDSYQTNTNNNPLSVQSDFWRINARVGFQTQDGRWDISLIGRNLTDELYQGGQADKPGGNGGEDLFGGVVRPRQVILQGTFQI